MTVSPKMSIGWCNVQRRRSACGCSTITESSSLRTKARRSRRLLELSHQLLDLRSPCIHVPDTAWFVPEIKDEKRIPREGKLVVTRTRDGGKSFDVLTNGLPQSHAYDIVYRHALALNLDGDCLALGSTTGGLWVSENQGESWACITHTLPPVYAVQFM